MVVDSGRALPEHVAELEGPRFPESLRYLWDWHRELRMGIREMMTWVDLDAWSRQMRKHPTPSENEALFYLDAIFRNPPKD